MTTPALHRFGWVRDTPDHRDIRLETTLRAEHLPPAVDLRAAHPWPDCYDQGQLGSCTANAIAGAVQYDQLKNRAPETMPSRLMIYYSERVTEHTVRSDAGAQIRDGIKAVHKVGTCAEAMWPYVPARFAKKPTKPCYAAAAKARIAGYRSVAVDEFAVKSALASDFPVVVGISVYDSFESDAVARSGIVPLPAKHESALGGHAVLVVGYSDAKQQFIVRNSWGTAWGQRGYFELPYAYLINPQLASDFWTIHSRASA